MKNIFFLLCYLPILFMGCQSTTGDAHDHGQSGHEHGANTHGSDEHSHEVENLSLTLWSSQTELFAEYQPLIVGQTSTFTTHLTHLNDYQAFNKGKLTVSLVKSKKGIRQSVESPVRSGIFTPALQPKEAGNYTLIFDVEYGNSKERFSIPNIKVYSNSEEAAHSITHDEQPNLVNYTKEQAWKNEFNTEEVTQKPFRDVIKTTGELISANENTTRVVAQTSGIVQFTSNKVVSGTMVSAQQALFHISGQELSDDNLAERYLAAKSEFEKARANFERAKKLHVDQIISEKDYLETKSTYEQAQIKFKLLDKNYSSNGIRIKSPVKGYISQIFVSQGEYVVKGQVLATVARNSKLVLRADVYQKELPRIGQVRSANFILPYDQKVFKTGELNGRLIAYGKDIRKNDYTTPLYFELDKTPELYSGTFVDVYLQSETQQEVLAVPKSAIMENQGTYFVFVQKEGEKFIKRYVKIGADNGLEVEIKEGLQKGERIVTKGAYFVRLASLGGALPAHSHSH